MNVRGIMLSASLPPENKKCRIRVDMNLIHYPLILHFYILCNPCISNPTNYFNIASLILYIGYSPNTSVPSSPYFLSLASNITEGDRTSIVCHTPLGMEHPYLPSSGLR